MSPEPRRIGTTIIELQQVDSTNNYATALAHAGMAGHGTIVLAQHQTAGKGQRYKGWSAAPGANITMSLLLQPEGLQLSDFFSFSMTLALAAQRFFAAYAGEETFVKWPNDLYWRDRKAGGILIENILAGDRWKWSVAGFGININQVDFGPAAPRAVSLRQITGREWPVKELAAELCTCVEAALQQLYEQPQSIATDYQSVLFGLGQTRRFRQGTRVFEAEVMGVDADGLLRLRHATEERFGVGEVEWLF